MMARPRAILFDLDGTLVDTAADVAAALDRLLVELGHAPLGQAAARGLIGGGARALVERGLRQVGDGRPHDLDRLTARWLDLYESAIAATSKPYPGVAATLGRLAEAGALLAVCTNKADHATRVLLDALGLSRHFAAVVGGDVPRRKPDPAHPRAVLDRLGVSAAEAVLVGDSDNDLQAARAAGLGFVAVTYGYGPLAVEARARSVDDFGAIAPLLGF